jgi:hypothetical protein
MLKLIKKPCSIIHKLGEKGMLKWISDELYIRIVFRCDAGYALNLEEPSTFGEKIQWTKLYDRKPEYKQYVDKIAVRTLIEQKIGAKYLIPIFQICDEPSQIRWEELPNRFVIKCSHDSASTIICRDKGAINREYVVKKIKKSQKRDWFWYGREWAYKDIKPRIIIEAFLSDNDRTPDDYKVLCCNGKAKEIEVHKDRFDNHGLQDYDTNWKCVCKTFEGYAEFDKGCERPECLEEMLAMSERLAANTIISRIDWYIVEGKLYFGEITLYESAGFFGGASQDWDKKIGGFVELPRTKTQIRS